MTGQAEQRGKLHRGIEKLLAPYALQHLCVDPRHAVIGRDELCRCSNGGRLLPEACFTGAR